MPHLTIEYTDNLPQFSVDNALLALNKALVASGQFEEVDIKSRAVKFATFCVGTSPNDRAFVHAKLAILSGRSIQTKHELSESLLLVLKQVCEWPARTHVQLCVEVQEIERESYAKTSIGS
ncbi:5-carboxymethyl-2-hydroxymuconate Delta-isomerase [Polaromonas sp. P1-6]|nr:5-carboxymethyl-2-hydroxymuconate Delta-isomerase [Polaromonas sp. P1-6]